MIRPSDSSQTTLPCPTNIPCRHPWTTVPTARSCRGRRAGAGRRRRCRAPAPTRPGAVPVFSKLSLPSARLTCLGTSGVEDQGACFYGGAEPGVGRSAAGHAWRPNGSGRAVPPCRRDRPVAVAGGVLFVLQPGQAGQGPVVQPVGLRLREAERAARLPGRQALVVAEDDRVPLIAVQAEQANRRSWSGPLAARLCTSASNSTSRLRALLARTRSRKQLLTSRHIAGLVKDPVGWPRPGSRQSRLKLRGRGFHARCRSSGVRIY
jgi:hypothetical protein